MRMETVITTTINDWRNNFHLESNVKLHAFCYNRARQNWEPFVEFCTKDDVNYKPCEFTIKVINIIVLHYTYLIIYYLFINIVLYCPQLIFLDISRRSEYD